MHNLCQLKLTVQLTNMNSRISIALFLLLFSSFCQGAELGTFDDIRTQYQTYRDPTRLSYLFNRCAALQLNVSALLERKGQKQGAKDFENLARHYMVLSEANERETDKKRGLKSKDTMKIVQRAVANVSESYSERMKRNYLRAGDYIRGDLQIESELQECMNPDTFVKKASKE